MGNRLRPMVDKWPELKPYLVAIEEGLANRSLRSSFRLEELLPDEWPNISHEKRRKIGEQFYDAVGGKYKFLRKIEPTAYPMPLQTYRLVAETLQP